MKKIYVLVIALICAITMLPAAITDFYNPPVASSGTYTAVVGGTSAGISGDDAFSAALPIGFTFSYCGADYTTFKMDTNGYINLGGNLSSYSYSNLLASTTVRPIIAGVWDDMSSPAGACVYLTTGSAPNRVLTAEWTNISWNYGGAASQNFQVQLFETTKQVKINYGTMVAPNSPSASIGMNMAPGGSGNFYSITPGSPMTYSSTTANNSIAAVTYLTSGTTYTFDAVVAGVVPGVASVVSPANAGTSIDILATLNWAAGSGVPSGYRLSFGTNNPPTNILNSSNLGLVTTYDPTPNMAYNTTYYWQVVPYNAIGDATGCPVWSFTTMADPTITTFPYTQTFDAVPPLGWSGAGGTYNWTLYNSGTDNWASANYWSIQAGGTGYLTSPPILATDPVSMDFTWSHQYMASYPTDALTIQTSTNGTTWSDVWTKAGIAFDSADGANTGAPGTGITESVALGFANTTFYLRVYGYSGYGPNAFIDDIVLTATAVGAPPNPAVVAAPLDAATGVAIGTNFSWTSGGGFPTGYKVYIGTDNPPTNIVNGVDVGLVLSYDLATDLAYATGYLWQVIPYNANGDAVGCPTWTFVTMSGIPNAPTLVAPANAAIMQPVAGPVLDWNAPATGIAPETYGIYISNDDTAPYDQFFVEIPAATTSYDASTSGLTFGNDTVWYWTVQASTSLGYAISDTWSFRTAPEGIISIGAGTGIGIVPVYPYWTYTFSQSIYLQSEINVSGKQIETLSWYWNGLSAISEPNIDIYMGHTALADLTTGIQPVSGMQLVYSGAYSMPATAGWITFTLSTPFVYNNVDNLIVAVNENGGPANTYYLTTDGFYQSATATARSTYLITDSAPYDAAAVTGGTSYLFIPNVQFTTGDAPLVPVFAVNPTTWNFGDVEQLNPVEKVFTISNAGAGTVEVTSLAVYNTVPGGAESNFGIYPVTLPVSLATGQTLNVTSRFLPATLGLKNGVLEIIANGVTHTVPLSGNGIAENQGDSVVLTGTTTGSDVALNWFRFAFDGILNWDSGVNTQAIGAGASTFDVAVKFPTAVLSHYAGQYINTVRYFPYTGATATDCAYTIEVWTGTDAVLAPTTLIYSLPVTPTYNVWNDVVIPGIAITGTEALYIGYNCASLAGFPAGCDAGPNVANGQLIQFNGAWSNLVDLAPTLTYNWNIQGVISATPAPFRGTSQLISVPVPQNVASFSTRARFSADPSIALPQPQRALQGYNVKRNGVSITPVLVSGLTYSDLSLADGPYEYQVEAVYYTGNVVSNTYSTVIAAAVLAAPVVTMSLNVTGLPKLEWPAVVGANSYYVYQYSDPYGAVSSIVGPIAETMYLPDGVTPFLFYKVTASTDLVP